MVQQDTEQVEETAQEVSSAHDTTDLYTHTVQFQYTWGTRYFLSIP